MKVISLSANKKSIYNVTNVAKIYVPNVLSIGILILHASKILKEICSNITIKISYNNVLNVKRELKKCQGVTI